MEPQRNLEIIKQAILNEVEGYRFYKLYAEKVTSPEVRDAFLKVAEEELEHIQYLKQLMNGSREDAMKMADLEVPAPGIFRFSALTPAELSLALAAFSIATKMEDYSQKFYGDAAASAQTKEEEVLFQRLQEWEITHRDAFEAKYLELKDDWWAENVFAPF